MATSGQAIAGLSDNDLQTQVKLFVHSTSYKPTKLTTAR